MIGSAFGLGLRLQYEILFQVAALQDGPEFLLGTRRNAHVNESKKGFLVFSK